MSETESLKSTKRKFKNIKLKGNKNAKKNPEDLNRNKKPTFDELKRKERALLDFMNFTLRKLRKHEINDVTKYRVEKEEICSINYESHMEEIENIIFPAYNRTEIFYYRFKIIGASYVPLFMKYALAIIGKKLIMESVKVTKII